jgi:hypothetical protein
VGMKTRSKSETLLESWFLWAREECDRQHKPNGVKMSVLEVVCLSFFRREDEIATVYSQWSRSGYRPDRTWQSLHFSQTREQTKSAEFPNHCNAYIGIIDHRLSQKEWTHPDTLWVIRQTREKLRSDEHTIVLQLFSSCRSRSRGSSSSISGDTRSPDHAWLAHHLSSNFFVSLITPPQSHHHSSHMNPPISHPMLKSPFYFGFGV